MTILQVFVAGVEGRPESVRFADHSFVVGESGNRRYGSVVVSVDLNQLPQFDKPGDIAAVADGVARELGGTDTLFTHDVRRIYAYDIRHNRLLFDRGASQRLVACSGADYRRLFARSTSGAVAKTTDDGKLVPFLDQSGRARTTTIAYYVAENDDGEPVEYWATRHARTGRPPLTDQAIAGINRVVLGCPPRRLGPWVERRGLDYVVVADRREAGVKTLLVARKNAGPGYTLIIDDLPVTEATGRRGKMFSTIRDVCLRRHGVEISDDVSPEHTRWVMDYAERNRR